MCVCGYKGTGSALLLDLSIHAHMQIKVPEYNMLAIVLYFCAYRELTP